MKLSILFLLASAFLLSPDFARAAGQGTPVKSKKVETTLVSPKTYVNSVQTSHEDWKGESNGSQLSLGAMTGLGVIDSSGGFTIMGTASKKVSDGWLADVNDAISVELELGPLFTSGTSAFVYAMHLRWDFTKDEEWTFYALGGVGGNVQGAALGDHFELFPRFGLGALWNVGLPFLLRAELSHELLAVGVNWPL